LGSVLGHLGIAKRAFEMMLKSAAEMQNVRVLFTTGKGFNVTELGPLPSHVHVEPWVDQDDVLAVASVVVCHAGSGTMLGALATGVPLVGVPFFVDQFDNADSICRLRAGIAIEIPRAADGSLDLSDAASLARRITEAAHHVLATPSYRQAAQAISLELESRLTPDEALARVIEN
jgi:UDP:flavonoid glycosyltransferase YjiC (YdhE family)